MKLKNINVTKMLKLSPAAFLSLVFYQTAAQASPLFSSPAAGSVLTSSSILKGSCNPSLQNSVVLSVSGLSSTRKVSCVKSSDNVGAFSFSLSNDFNSIPKGNITFYVQQGSIKGQRSYSNPVSPTREPSSDEPVVPVPSPIPVVIVPDSVLEFSSPAQNSNLSSSSTIKGLCDPSQSSSVVLGVVGLSGTRSVGCQKITERSGTFTLALSSVYGSLPKAEVNFTATQAGKTSYRKFTNIISSPVPESPSEPTPVPTPEPPPPVVVNPPTEPYIGLDPSRNPAENFDLSLWKLTLPISDLNDIYSFVPKKAIELRRILPTDVVKPYFYTASDGGVVFRAPTNGSTTSGSKYPRSELRELNSDGTLKSWYANEVGELHATLAVNEIPTREIIGSDGQITRQPGRIVIGQIHGPNDELCRLYYDNGQIYFYDDKAGLSQKETKFQLKSSTGAEPNIPINDVFDYSIVVKNNIQTVTVKHKGVTYTAVDPLVEGGYWITPDPTTNKLPYLYFKSGLYIQVGLVGSGAGATGVGSGQVTFYRLDKPKH